MKYPNILLAAVASQTLGAATITYNIENPSGLGSEFAMISGNGSPLPVGSRIEFGYFSEGTETFAGIWTPLATGAIGDGAQPAGYFRTAFVVDYDTAPGNQLAFGTQLGLRIYDTADDTGRYNSMTNTSAGGDVPSGASEWRWTINQSSLPVGVPPANSLLLTDSSFSAPSMNLLWETGQAFTVPEPSTIPLLLLSGAALMGRRRR